jgi:EAL domain-containing protein (putative c-di-GMP-specific phosphodiesterase class I)
MIRLALQGIHNSRGAVMANEVLARMECPLSGRLYLPNDFGQISGLSWADIDVEVYTHLSRNSLFFNSCLPLFLNISSETLSCSVTLKTCADLLRTITANRSGSVVVEIPETSAIENEELNRVLEVIESAGAMVAIDDFGSLYSVMGRLDGHSWDFCKVDLESFIASDDLDWLMHLKEKCQARNIKVVFERLERARDKDILSVIPDAWIQGYAYSRPWLLLDSEVNVQSMPHTSLTDRNTLVSDFKGAL